MENEYTTCVVLKYKLSYSQKYETNFKNTKATLIFYDSITLNGKGKIFKLISKSSSNVK
jgi:hypothetical protein